MSFVKMFLWICFVIAVVPSSVAKAQDEMIKVAFIPSQYGFYAMEDNGGFSGYNHDYLMLLGQYTGWKYEFVVIEEETVEESFELAAKMLETEEIDLLGSVFYSEEAEERFELGDLHYSVARYSLATLRNNSVVTVDNYFLHDNLRIALVEGEDLYNSSLLKVLDLREINYTVEYVPTREVAIERMTAEEADCTLFLDVSEWSKTLEKLSTIYRLPVYFAAKKGNTELVDEISQAISLLEQAEPEVHQRLLDKYFGLDYDGNILLSHSEQELIESLDTLNVGLIRNTFPYQFENGDAQPTEGISIEIFDMISEILGVNFHYIWLEDGEDVAQAMAEQRIDLTATVPYDFQAAQQFGLTMTRPYISSGVYWLHSSIHVEDPTILFYLVSDNIPFYPDEELFVTTEIEKDIQTLAESGEFSIFCDSYVGQYYIDVLKLRSIEVQTVSSVLSEIAIGVGSHMDNQFVTVLNRAILHLDPFEVDEIIYRNVNSNEELTMAEFFREHAILIVFWLCLGLSAIIFALIHYSSKMRLLSQADGLTKLKNAGYFHKTAEQRTVKMDSGILILVDIDFFKEVNDTHGHQTGDRVIQAVANQLKQSFPANALVARLGGDEFVVLVEGDFQRQKMEEISQTILHELLDNGTGVPVTLSIGGHFFRCPTPYDELYRLADKTLYVVKEQGRNGYEFSESSS